MNNEMIESIFGCLERIEDKLDKQPVQSEQGESENNKNLAEALMPLVDSMNRTSRNLSVLRDALKIISDRQKNKVVIAFAASLVEELLANVKHEIQTLANKDLSNVNVIWLERNVRRGNDDGIRQCQQFVINYEDSIRHRYEMEQEAAMRDSIGRLMIQQSQDIKNKLK